MKKYFQYSASYLLVSLCVLAMQGQYKPLSINDTMPNIELQSVINNDGSNFRMSDFKGKLLLIDFWATWCSPCVAALTKLDSFQHRYRDSIQIVSVSNEDSTTVNKLFTKRGRPYSPIVIVSDTTLYKLFPHTFLPHLVWVNQSGVVIAITEGGDLTSTNIETALKRQSLTYTLKKDGDRLVEAPPLFVTGSRVTVGSNQSVEIVDDRNLPYVSTIYRGSIDGFGGMFSTGDTNRITYVNTCARNLFQAAYSYDDWGFLTSKRVFVESRDSNQIVSNLSGNALRQWWKAGNGYSYELRVPPNLSNRRFQIMQDELNLYFGATLHIEAVWEKKVLPALILRRISNKVPSPGANDSSLFDANPYYFSGKSIKIEQLLNVLRFYFQNMKLPLLDETHLKEKIDLELNCPLSDLDRVNEELKKVGLQFTLSKRKMDVVVIRDKN